MGSPVERAKEAVLGGLMRTVFRRSLPFTKMPRRNLRHSSWAASIRSLVTGSTPCVITTWTLPSASYHRARR
jgi:hypothetical protein